jgi:hypothetical protein
MKWKVDKMIFERIVVVENHLNKLSDAGWEIYKIHFSQTSMTRVDEVTIVSMKR